MKMTMSKRGKPQAVQSRLWSWSGWVVAGDIRNMSLVLVQRHNSLAAWALVRPFLFSRASTSASGAEVRVVRHIFRDGGYHGHDRCEQWIERCNDAAHRQTELAVGPVVNSRCNLPKGTAFSLQVCGPNHRWMCELRSKCLLYLR